MPRLTTPTSQPPRGLSRFDLASFASAGGPFGGATRWLGISPSRCLRLCRRASVRELQHGAGVLGRAAGRDLWKDHHLRNDPDAQSTVRSLTRPPLRRLPYASCLGLSETVIEHLHDVARLATIPNHALALKHGRQYPKPAIG